MIEVNETIDVPYTARTVWKLLSDPHAVVACVPGAALTEEYGDGTYEGTMTVQFGPAKVTFRAHVTLELDHIAMTGQVVSKGKDKQGTTRFSSTMHFRVQERTGPARTAIVTDANVEIGGRMASLVETGAKFVVKRLVGQFSEQLVARCATIDEFQMTGELQR